MTDEVFTDKEPDSQPSGSQVKNYRFPLGIFLILGALLGILLLWIYMSGVTGGWRLLNPPPSRPVEFAGVSIYFYQADPFIKAEDEHTYFCDAGLNPGSNGDMMVCNWQIQQPGSDVVQPECRQGGVKFSSWKAPFSGVADCTQVTMPGEFIGAPQVTFVIDSDGELWYWASENSGNLVFYLPVAIILGLLAGFVVALVWSPILSIFRKPEPEYKQALRIWESRTLRRGARVMSIPSLIYFAAMIFINLREFPPDNLSDALVAFSVLGGALGLILCWRWEIIGGTLVMLAALAMIPRHSFVSESPSNLDIGFILVSWIPYLPGLFFLLAGILSPRKPKKGEQENP